MRAITGNEGDLALACSTMSDTQSSVTRVVTVSSSSMYVSLKLAGLGVGSRSKNVAAFACRSAYLTSPPGRLAAHFVHFHRQFVARSVILAVMMTGGLTAASCPATATGPATARGPSEASAAVSASAAVPASVAGASSVDAAPATGAAASAVAAAAAASTTTGAVPATCTCAGATGATGAAAAAASLLRRCFSRLRLWLCLG